MIKKVWGSPPSPLRLPSSLTAVAKAMAVKKLRRTGRRASRVQRFRSSGFWSLVVVARYSMLDSVLSTLSSDTRNLSLTPALRRRIQQGKDFGIMD
jgi:hypothetical protein